MKILNLYSGIGGNRRLWEDVDVTAVEINPEVAGIYHDLFPKDRVIIDDAHEYLLKHYKEFNIIWSSPKCQSHSKFRKNVACSVEIRDKGRWANPVYPDMNLYQEIIFLQHYFKGYWVVENVEAYYEPLIKPIKLQRHWFWSNFDIPQKKFKIDNVARASISEMQSKYGFDLSKYKISSRKKGQSRDEVLEKDQILRNCVDPQLGDYVFNLALQSFRKVEIE
jgi:DNA (cytosine-5)-methyltransferase 1